MVVNVDYTRFSTPLIHGQTPVLTHTHTLHIRHYIFFSLQQRFAAVVVDAELSHVARHTPLQYSRETHALLLTLPPSALILLIRQIPFAQYKLCQHVVDTPTSAPNTNSYGNKHLPAHTHTHTIIIIILAVAAVATASGAVSVAGRIHTSLRHNTLDTHTHSARSLPHAAVDGI
jgi:hypothetical protein